MMVKICAASTADSSQLARKSCCAGKASEGEPADRRTSAGKTRIGKMNNQSSSFRLSASSYAIFLTVALHLENSCHNWQLLV
jgi:hypothetical protein